MDCQGWSQAVPCSWTVLICLDVTLHPGSARALGKPGKPLVHAVCCEMLALAVLAKPKLTLGVMGDDACTFQGSFCRTQSFWLLDEEPAT